MHLTNLKMTYDTGRREVLCIMQNSQENTYVGVSFMVAGWRLKNKTLTQMFSFEFCEIFENGFLCNTSGDCFWINPGMKTVSVKY